jgi:CRISPR-associated protein Csb2
MSLAISIRFLTGRAHLHPWQTHHSEGRVEWPPSHWRLLRAVVAVAGRGLTSLSASDWFAYLGKKPRAAKKNSEVVWPSPGYCSLPDNWSGDGADEIPLSRLARLIAVLSATPSIWLPRTSGGHTRQYFPIHDAGMVKNTGSAVFDTFATVAKNQPVLFDWPDVCLDSQQELDLKLVLNRMTYFGRAESWSRAQVHVGAFGEIDDIVIDGINKTHWRCVCIEDQGKADGVEYRDYTLERRLAPVPDINIKAEAVALLPRTKPSEGKERKADDVFGKILELESSDALLLRCLLRESGQDIRDGLERPIGTRWVHYAVPRAIYEVPRPKPQARPRKRESVNLVRYALNTASANRPVLPPLTDTLLVADRFRAAIMALRGEPSRSLSGHEADGTPIKDNDHASWWPVDEDCDGFIDHVMVWTPAAFEADDIDALQRVTRIRQRGGRPDLLVTPTFVGLDSDYAPWISGKFGDDGSRSPVTDFVSATPYFCPVHLSHGRCGSGRSRPILPELMKGLRIKGVIGADDEVPGIDEIVFDYSPLELAGTLAAVEDGRTTEPVPPRQFFPIIGPPGQFPPLPRTVWAGSCSFGGSFLKNPDDAFPFGLSVGLMVNEGTRFIRAASFCRRRRQHQVRGIGRMFRIRFREPRQPRPFAIGDQCHYGLGLFVPVPNNPQLADFPVVQFEMIGAPWPNSFDVAKKK